jgi:hypothetical protein
MSRQWTAAALAASLIAFAFAYLLASSDAGSAAAPPQTHRLRLDAGPAPRSWHRVQLPGSPASLAFPAGWRPIGGDPGTASAGLRSKGRIVGYLNATPQGGEETLANWSRFRPAHNTEEGDVDVVTLAAGRGLRFGSAMGSCVIDGYTSSTGARYRELACIVAGQRTTVVVGSALQSSWPQIAPALRRAVSSFTT